MLRGVTYTVGLVLQLLVLLSSKAAASEAGFCLQGARSLPAGSDAAWAPASRPMPPRHPHLSAYDWPLDKPAKRQQLASNYRPCHAEAPIFRYKVSAGAIYADHDHNREGRYHSYRQGFLEQLVLTVWLYKDFPEVELVVDFTDHPQLCDQDIPFLRYSILNTSLLPAGQHYNLTELLSPAWVTPDYATRVTSHTRGFTIPSPEAWRDLSLSTQQLQDFGTCMDTTHPWATKRPVVFWRGQATGCSRGWPMTAPAASKQQHQATAATALTAAAAAGGAAGADAEATAGQPSSPAAGPAPHLLRNKRVQLALRLFPYGDAAADVGITSLPRLTPECLGTPPGSQAVQPGADTPAAAAVMQQQQGPHDAASRQPGLRRRRRRQRRRQHRRPAARGHALLPGSLDKSFLTWHMKGGSTGRDGGGDSGNNGQQQAAAVTAAEGPSTRNPLLGGRRRLLWRWPWRQRNQPLGQQQQQQLNAGGSSPQDAEASGGLGAGGGSKSEQSHASKIAEGGDGAARSPGRGPYRAVASMLHKEGLGLEGWADAAVTLSIDGYGPPFRLPQQLLLGSTVLKMSSPYQCWLDWHLEAGRHFQPFSYDLSDLEQQVAKSVAAVLHEKVADSSSSDASPAADARGGSWLRDVAIAARGAVAERVNVLAQLDAFAWSVARYKEACNWETQQVPPEGDAVWQLLQLDPIGVFQSKGVPSEVQLQVMQHLQQNFRAALATNQALSAGGMQ